MDSTSTKLKRRQFWDYGCPKNTMWHCPHWVLHAHCSVRLLTAGQTCTCLWWVPSAGHNHAHTRTTSKCSMQLQRSCRRVVKALYSRTAISPLTMRLPATAMMASKPLSFGRSRAQLWPSQAPFLTSAMPSATLLKDPRRASWASALIREVFSNRSVTTFAHQSFTLSAMSAVAPSAAKRESTREACCNIAAPWNFSTAFKHVCHSINFLRTSSFGKLSAQSWQCASPWSSKHISMTSSCLAEAHPTLSHNLHKSQGRGEKAKSRCTPTVGRETSLLVFLPIWWSPLKA